MKLLSSCLALLALAGCASIAPKPTIGHAGYIGTSGFDIYSTQKALDGGAVELNGIYGDNPSVAKMAAIKTGGFVVMRLLENVIEDEIGRPLRWWEQTLLFLPSIAINTWAGFHNLAVARRE